MAISGDIVKGIVEGAASGLDKLFTSDNERLQAYNKTLEIVTQPHIMQAQNNIEDAKAARFFQSGWRPFLGWMSGFCLMYAWFFKDLMLSIMVISMDTVAFTRLLPYLPRVDAGEMLTLVMALLGLGGLRTYEKFKGLTK